MRNRIENTFTAQVPFVLGVVWRSTQTYSTMALSSWRSGLFSTTFHWFIFNTTPCSGSSRDGGTSNTPLITVYTFAPSFILLNKKQYFFLYRYSAITCCSSMNHAPYCTLCQSDPLLAHIISESDSLRPQTLHVQITSKFIKHHAHSSFLSCTLCVLPLCFFFHFSLLFIFHMLLRHFYSVPSSLFGLKSTGNKIPFWI